MFVVPVPVGCDVRRADVRALADARVADVGQVRHLGVGCDVAVLHLDVGADDHVVGERRAGTDPRERPDGDVALERGAFDDREPDRRAVADGRVADLHAGSDPAVPADARVALDRRVRADRGLGADRDADVDVGRVRVEQRDAVGHVHRVDPLAHDAGHRREPAARVEAHHAAGVDGDRGDRRAFVEQDREHAIQVELALAIVVADGREHPEEVLAAEDRREQPHLADRTLCRRRVGVLHDLDEPIAVADHAAVAPRVIDLGGRDRRRGLAPAMRPDERLHVVGGDRVVVAAEHEHVDASANDLLRGGDGVARAELRHLFDEQRGGRDPPGRDGCADVVGAVPDDDHDLRGLRTERRLHDVPQSRLPADRVQHLG